MFTILFGRSHLNQAIVPGTQIIGAIRGGGMGAIGRQTKVLPRRQPHHRVTHSGGVAPSLLQHTADSARAYSSGRAEAARTSISPPAAASLATTRVPRGYVSALHALRQGARVLWRQAADAVR
jgi:hypothetical protein